jgi:hypothetical protein
MLGFCQMTMSNSALNARFTPRLFVTLVCMFMFLIGMFKLSVLLAAPAVCASVCFQPSVCNIVFGLSDMPMYGHRVCCQCYDLLHGMFKCVYQARGYGRAGGPSRVRF